MDILLILILFPSIKETITTVTKHMLKLTENNLLPLSISTSPNCVQPGFVQYSSINKLQLDASQDQTSKSIENKTTKQHRKQNQGGDVKKKDEKYMKKLVGNKLGNVQITYKNITERAAERADNLSKVNDFGTHLYKNTNKNKTKTSTNYSALNNKTMGVKPYPVAHYKTKHQNLPKETKYEVNKGQNGQKSVQDQVNINVSIINGLEEPTNYVLDTSPGNIEKANEGNSVLRKKYKSENKLKKYNYLEVQPLRRPQDLEGPVQTGSYLNRHYIKSKYDIAELTRKHQQQFGSLNHYSYQNYTGGRVHSKSGKSLNSYIQLLGHADQKEKAAKIRERSIEYIKHHQTQSSRPVSKLKQRRQGLTHSTSSYQTLKTHKYNYLQEINTTENKNRQMERIRSRQKQIKQRQRRLIEKQRELGLKNYKQHENLRQIERQLSRETLFNKEKQVRQKERVALQKQIQTQRQRSNRQIQRQRKKRQVQRLERMKARENLPHHELIVRNQEMLTVRQREQPKQQIKLREKYSIQVIPPKSTSSNIMTETNRSISHNQTPQIKQFQLCEQVGQTSKCNCHHQQCQCLNMTTELNTSRLNRLNNKLESYIARNMNIEKSNNFDKKAHHFYY